AVAGRTPEYDIGDEYRPGGIFGAARQTGGFEHAIEELARSADEGLALEVLIAAGRLADAHHMRLGIAVAQGKVGRRALERAGIEPRQRGDNVVERLTRGGDGLCVIDRICAPNSITPARDLDPGRV